MKHTLSSSKNLFDIDSQNAAAMVAMLNSLNVGEEFSTKLGKIKKLDDNTFKIELSDSHLNNIVEELTDDGDIGSIFTKSSGSRSTC